MLTLTVGEPGVLPNELSLGPDEKKREEKKGARAGAPAMKAMGRGA